MPSLARSALLRMSKSRWLSDKVMTRSFARKAVKKFMPGEELGDALDASVALSKDRLGTVLTKLGENLTAQSEADAVRDHYLEVIGQVAARKLNSHVSVKPTQLGLDFSQSRCAEHLETLAQKAEALGVYFWLDMEDSSYVDRTLELYRTLRSRHRRVGLAMQAYLRRTPQDLAALLPLQPTVRLVKGAYAEPAHVAFPAKRDTDLAYYDLAVELLNAAAKGNALPIFGTHDIGLLERITGKASALKVPDTGYEIHMLYGIRMAEQRALAARGRTVKTLISYGSSWFPWYMRRLAERPANVWFVVKSAFS
ncbi:MAG TPA: proline dehydrogenase family protein [Gemmatimonadales bacterium]|nr:proline dehydrogenase family protein [Gemmatimonadales bacterium]